MIFEILIAAVVIVMAFLIVYLEGFRSFFVEKFKRIFSIFARKDSVQPQDKIEENRMPEQVKEKTEKKDGPPVDIEALNKMLEEHSKKEELLKISSKNLEDVLRVVENDKLKDSVAYLRKDGKINFNENLLVNSKKDAEEFLKQEILEFLKSWADSLKQRISDLRKSGYDVELESINLMKIPLKIKIFYSSTDKKDLENITSVLDLLEKKLVSLEEEKRLKEEKEAQEPLKKEEFSVKDLQFPTEITKEEKDKILSTKESENLSIQKKEDKDEKKISDSKGKIDSNKEKTQSEKKEIQ